MNNENMLHPKSGKQTMLNSHVNSVGLKMERSIGGCKSGQSQFLSGTLYKQVRNRSYNVFRRQCSAFVFFQVSKTQISLFPYLNSKFEFYSPERKRVHFVDAEKRCKTYSGPICTMYLLKIEIAHFCARQFRTPILSPPVLNIASSSSFGRKNLCLGKIKFTEAEIGGISAREQGAIKRKRNFPNTNQTS